MPIPTARTIVNEVLQHLADENNHLLSSVQRHIIEAFSITEDELAQRLPSGRESTLANRFRNAMYLMRKDALIESPSPSEVRISRKGKTYIGTAPRAVTYTTIVTPKKN